MSTTNENTLHLGICLAGAVSAGAYTAGVMDYLLEALEEWEKRKAEGAPNTPTHSVIIPAIGGASAGGMTGIIAATMVNSLIKPVSMASPDILAEHPENKLYHSWVDLLDEDMFPRLLDPADINGSIRSLVNSDFIDEVADRAIKPASGAPVNHPYFDPDLKIFTTLTNLKGFSYDTRFAGEHEESNYYFSRHQAYAAFKLNSHGEDPDGWIPLNFNDEQSARIAKDAAMATGAFPLGLRARMLTRDSKQVNLLLWNRDITRNHELTSDKDTTLCVDGGVINNEPFYKVMNMLEVLEEEKAKGKEDVPLEKVEQKAEQKSEPGGGQTLDNFKHTTLIIDPFPSQKPSEFEADKDDVFSVAQKTLGALLSQVRLKPETLKKIKDESDPSLYMIAPVRYPDSHKKISGSKAIACGFLGGFGGFIHKEFRIHDFFLGRANCEKFLRDYFTVPADTQNPIFKNGYEGVDTKDLKTTDGKLPVIPVFTPRKTEGYMPVFENGSRWPVRQDKDVERYRGAIKKRIGSIIMSLSNYDSITRILLWIGNRVVLRRKIADSVMRSIKADMVSWGLLPDASKV